MGSVVVLQAVQARPSTQRRMRAPTFLTPVRRSVRQVRRSLGSALKDAAAAFAAAAAVAASASKAPPSGSTGGSRCIAMEVAASRSAQRIMTASKGGGGGRLSLFGSSTRLSGKAAGVGGSPDSLASGAVTPTAAAAVVGTDDPLAQCQRLPADATAGGPPSKAAAAETASAVTEAIVAALLPVVATAPVPADSLETTDFAWRGNSALPGVDLAHGRESRHALVLAFPLTHWSPHHADVYAPASRTGSPRLDPPPTAEEAMAAWVASAAAVATEALATASSAAASRATPKQDAGRESALRVSPLLALRMIR